MRSLAEPRVLLRALLAGGITALACHPRIANWVQRPDAVWFLVTAVGWAGFVMWAAVFAWQEKHGQCEVFPRSVPAKLWFSAVALGCAGAVISFHFGDPILRRLAPTDFPANPTQWTEHLLFNLAMEQPFLCFAPFAFGVRLLPGVKSAAVATGLFALFVFGLKLSELEHDLPTGTVLALMTFRAVQSAVVLWLYVRGGAWLAWLFALLIQSRHWFAFAP